MSEISEAFEEYLRSLSQSEWDALEKRVREPSTGEALDAQIMSDPQILATLEGQIQALQTAITGLDAQIVSAELERNTILSIMCKQERYRLQVALSDVTADYEQRQRRAAESHPTAAEGN